MANLKALNAEVNRIKSKYNGIEKLLNGAVDPLINELKEKYRNDLGAFTEDFWPYAGTSTPLKKGYSFEARVIHGKAFQENKIKFLLWTEPPKEGKSTFWNVIYPAWIWIKNPKERFLNTCYAERYATRDNEYMQNIIRHPAFQQLFGMDFYLTKQNRMITQNNLGGERIAASYGGQITSGGGTIISFDDPNNIKDKNNVASIEKVCEDFDNIFIHRQIDPETTRFLIGQHRVHPNDLFGHVKAKNLPGTVCVEIPFQFKSARRCTTYLPGSDKILWQDPRTFENEYINPERHSVEQHEFIRSTMSPLAYSSLYQCEPLPTSGGIFERNWFKVWNHGELPPFEFIITSWDTAISTSSTASFSACSSYGLFRDERGVYNVMLLSFWYGRVEWNDLRKMVIRMSKNIFDTDLANPMEGSYPCTHLLIEAKANGISLAQSLREIGLNALQYTPPALGTTKYGKTEDGKTMRARLTQPYVESGRVYVMGKYPYIGKADYFGERFIDICTQFPHVVGEARDLMDTFTMTIDWLADRKYIGTEEHYKPQRYEEAMEATIYKLKDYDYRDKMRLDR